MLASGRSLQAWKASAVTENPEASDIDPTAQPGERSDRDWQSIAFAGVLFAAGLVFLVQSFAIRSQAGLWPRGLATLLVALAAAQLFILIRRWRLAATPEAVAPAPASEPGFLASGAARRSFTALWLLVYCVGAQWVGFGPAMVVMMPLYMWLMGYRRPIAIVLITAGAAASMTYVFDAVAFVPVWKGGL
jgi:hypothetical protein